MSISDSCGLRKRERHSLGLLSSNRLSSVIWCSYHSYHLSNRLLTGFIFAVEIVSFANPILETFFIWRHFYPKSLRLRVAHIAHFLRFFCSLDSLSSFFLLIRKSADLFYFDVPFSRPDSGGGGSSVLYRVLFIIFSIN